jgi:predicted site-specific integrase-resolvase
MRNIKKIVVNYIDQTTKEPLEGIEKFICIDDTEILVNDDESNNSELLIQKLTDNLNDYITLEEYDQMVNRSWENETREKYIQPRKPEEVI